MLKFLNLKTLRYEGFLLLEVLVAITVIIVGLVGVVGLIVYNISISRASPEKVIAVNLAQEGIEVVRNIRDSNWLAGVAWDQDIPSGNSIPIFTDNNRNDWPSDPDKWRLSHIGAAESWKEDVYYDDIDKFYGQSKKQSTNPAQFPDDWISTSFTRKITITKFFVIDENPRKFAFIKIVMAKFWPSILKVISQVDWTDRSGNPHTITLEDHLYDYELPENNPPVSYQWEMLYGGCFGNPITCFTDPDGIGISYATQAPCDTGNGRECWKLNGKTAFDGDPDWLWDQFNHMATCGWALPAPNCMSNPPCCDIYKKVEQ